MNRCWTTACFAGAALSFAGSASAIDFTAGAALPSPARPGGAAIADFNNDGRNDLAVTADTPDRIILFFGNGDGTFGPPQNIPTGGGTGPDSIVAVNIDADANIDLVVALHNANTVRTYINNGSGSFTAGTNASTGGDPRRLIAVNLDDDTDLDFAVANRDTDNVTVIRNDAGSLAAGVNIPAGGEEPRGVAAGDFNNDGLADLAVACHDDRTVRILSGTAPFAYTLTDTLSVPSSTRPDGIATADMEGDGDLDLVTVISDDGFSAMSVFDNNAGDFNEPNNYPTGGANPSAVVVVDLNFDARPDVVISHEDSGNVAVIENTAPDGGFFDFAPPVLLPTGANPEQPAVGDLDGDTALDIAVPNRDADTTSILINNTEPPPPMCEADFNADGVVNSQDFFDFLDPFFASDPAADFNADAVVNSQDFFDFLTAFFAKCP